MIRPQPNVAKFVRLARCRLRISQEELADALGVSRPSIAHYELGKTVPTGKTVLTLIGLLSEKQAASVIYEVI